MDTGKRLDDMLFIVNSLIDLLTEENAALEADQLDVVNGLLERKNKLCRAYEIRVFGLKQGENEEFSDDDLAKVATLRELAPQIDELIVQNERKLGIGLEVRRRFMDAVANAVKKSTPGTGAYAPNGTSDAQTYSARTNAPSLALDEVL
jgi:flagellar biosynthesis/type III secretory pathway chaperone